MNALLRHPVVMQAIALPVLWLAVQAGAWLSRRRPIDRSLHEAFHVVQAAAMTLLGLILAFSFSMALGRYDQRKTCEEAEANAIGTEFIRADLLPAADAARTRALLNEWLQLRITYYTLGSAQEAAELEPASSRLQASLWRAVLAPAKASPTPVTALAVSGMNDVLNAQGYTQAAWLNRIPVGAWALIGVVAIFCNVLVGADMARSRLGVVMPLLLPAVVSAAIFLIADIESPRGGLIRVQPHNLLILARSLPGP